MSGFDPMKGLTLFGEDRYVLVDDAGRVVITFDAEGDSLMATTVFDIAALAALNDAGFANGAPVAMTVLRDFWTLEKDSPEAPDGITIVGTLSGVGNWHRACLPHDHWRRQLDWWLDSVAGDNENDGAAITSPIKTFDEFRRRKGKLLASPGSPPVPQSLTILDTGSVPQDFIVDMLVRERLESFSIIGSTTVIYSGSVTGYVARNPGAQQEAQLTDAALPVSWTASGLIHKQMILTSGLEIGATAYISSEPGAKTALMPYFLDALGSNEVEPALADTFDVFEQTTIEGVIYIDAGDGDVFMEYVNAANHVGGIADVYLHAGTLRATRCAVMGTGYNSVYQRGGICMFWGGMDANAAGHGRFLGGLFDVFATLASSNAGWLMDAGSLTWLAACTFDASGEIGIAVNAYVYAYYADNAFLNCGANRPFVLAPDSLLEAEEVLWGTTGNAPTYAFSLGNMATIAAEAINLQIMGGTINDILLGSVGAAYGAARPMVDAASEAKVLDLYHP